MFPKVWWSLKHSPPESVHPWVEVFGKKMWDFHSSRCSYHAQKKFDVLTDGWTTWIHNVSGRGCWWSRGPKKKKQLHICCICMWACVREVFWLLAAQVKYELYPPGLGWQTRRQEQDTAVRQRLALTWRRMELVNIYEGVKISPVYSNKQSARWWCCHYSTWLVLINETETRRTYSLSHRRQTQ